MILNISFDVGMLSKSRSQALRLAPVLHLFFHLGKPNLPNVVSEEAIVAAINFVKVSCQHASIIAGKGTIEDVLQRCKSGK